MSGTEPEQAEKKTAAKRPATTTHAFLHLIFILLWYNLVFCIEKTAGYFHRRGADVVNIGNRQKKGCFTKRIRWRGTKV